MTTRTYSGLEGPTRNASPKPKTRTIELSEVEHAHLLVVLQKAEQDALLAAQDGEPAAPFLLLQTRLLIDKCQRA